MKNKKEEILEALGEIIGEASMCWDETPKGVLDSVKAFKAAILTLLKKNITRV